MSTKFRRELKFASDLLLYPRRLEEVLSEDATEKKKKKKTDSGTRRGFDVQIKPVGTINYPRKGGQGKNGKKKHNALSSEDRGGEKRTEEGQKRERCLARLLFPSMQFHRRQFRLGEACSCCCFFFFLE